MKVTFNTRAAESGETVSTFLVFPAASGVAAKPPPTAEPLAAEPPTAAQPLSLLRRLRFEGLVRTVADPDMILEGGSSRVVSVYIIRRIRGSLSKMNY
jgi:hypothetical protein